MCDSFAQNYSSVLSADTSLEPTIITFSGKNCTGRRNPGSGGTFVNKTWTAESVSNVKSLFIPSQYKQVVLTSTVGGKTKTLYGPVFIRDVSQFNWGDDSVTITTNDDMESNPIAQISVTTREDWSIRTLSACMGTPHYIGSSILTNYVPQSEHCDAYMTSYCASNIGNTECGCFDDALTIQQKSLEIGIDLPVISFGVNCARNNCYKTNAMLSKPSNSIICRQLYNIDPGVLTEINAEIVCGGQFYKQSNTFKTDEVETIKAVSNIDKEGVILGMTWYELVIIGSACIVLLVLIPLMLQKIDTSEISGKVLTYGKVQQGGQQATSIQFPQTTMYPSQRI